MFENYPMNLSILVVAVCTLYIFGCITVGIISKKQLTGFQIGFIWSICFTPMIGLYLVLKADPLKNKK